MVRKNSLYDKVAMFWFLFIPGAIIATLFGFIEAFTPLAERLEPLARVTAER